VAADLTPGRVLLVTRYPVKAMAGVSVSVVEVDDRGFVGDRLFAVFDSAGKMATGKHSRRFRRMDPVFELATRFDDGRTVIVLPDGSTVAPDSADADPVLSAHFGEPVTVRVEAEIPHFDAMPVSVVGTATLTELGRHEGDGRPVNPRHLRANVVVETQVPYAEEAWIGHDLTLGSVRVHVDRPIERCRMVGVAQVGLPARPEMLKTISDRHGLFAGVYAAVRQPGTTAVGDAITVP
jgi:uncharacterized protein YcbX